MTDPAVEATADAMARWLADLAGRCSPDGVVDGTALDRHQIEAYELAMASARLEAARRVAAGSDLTGRVGHLSRAMLLDDCWSGLRRCGRAETMPASVASAVSAVNDPESVAEIARRLVDGERADRGLDEDMTLLADSFRRFATDRLAPLAEEVHRHDRDVPESVIAEMGRMGVFGMSIPEEYGGFVSGTTGSGPAMVLATEELSRGALWAGSLLTRPEILVTSVLTGGTDEQKRRWLPGIASGSTMVAVSVTEPDHGSDVAAITTSATRAGDVYVLNGSKMWATFAGRAELLLLLARTNPDRSAGARGLSLFVVDKPAFAGHEFRIDQPGGGVLEGRAIPTLGYRGLHSFELTFDDFAIPSDCLIGGKNGEGRGFALQMGGFASGRLQTAARALGLMEAALDEAVAYASTRTAFGSTLAGFPLMQRILAHIAARLHAGRSLAYAAAAAANSPDGPILAAMAKAIASRDSEMVTRDAMQVHGGYGYAEEYPVSRLFVDARVLSIFEGTEEILAVKVIARHLLRTAHRP